MKVCRVRGKPNQFANSNPIHPLSSSFCYDSVTIPIKWSSSVRTKLFLLGSTSALLWRQETNGIEQGYHRRQTNAAVPGTVDHALYSKVMVALSRCTMGISATALRRLCDGFTTALQRLYNGFTTPLQRLWGDTCGG